MAVISKTSFEKYIYGETKFYFDDRGRRGRMVVRFTTTVQSVPITINIVSSNPAQDEVYNIM